MKKIENNNRRYSKKGFTLIETMLTIIIMSLAMMLVSSGVMVAHKVLEDAQLKADAQTLMATSVTALNAELVKAGEVAPEEGGSAVVFYSEKRGCYMRVYNDDGTYDTVNNENYGILIAIADTPDGTRDNTVYTWVPLVTQQTSSVGLYAKVSGITISGGDSSCICYTMKVYNSDGEEMETQDVVVHSSVTPEQTQS